MRVLSSFLLSLFLASAAQAAEVPKAILDAALKEGKVTWYAQPGAREQFKGALEEWKRRYKGIELSIVEASGPDSLERVRAEKRGGNPIGDLFTVGDIVSWGLPKENLPLAFGTDDIPNVKRMLPQLDAVRDPQNRWVPTFLLIFGINVNTKILPQNEWPQSWADLLKPQYKGKIALHDISRPGGGSSWVAMARDTLGDDFFRKLLQQDPRTMGRAQEVESAVIRGERPIGLPGRTRTAKDFPDAPLQWIAPSDGVFFIPLNTVILAHAKNPNAAKVLLNFLLEETAQKEIAAVNDGPVIAGVPSAVDLSKVKLLGKGGPVQEQHERYLDAFKFAREIGGR